LADAESGANEPPEGESTECGVVLRRRRGR